MRLGGLDLALIPCLVSSYGLRANAPCSDHIADSRMYMTVMYIHQTYLVLFPGHSCFTPLFVKVSSENRYTHYSSLHGLQ